MKRRWAVRMTSGRLDISYVLRRFWTKRAAEKFALRRTEGQKKADQHHREMHWSLNGVDMGLSNPNFESSLTFTVERLT